MEHRWGQRRDVHLRVRLRTHGGLVARGTLLNISMSGAFVATAFRLQPLSHVRMFVMPQHGQAMPAGPAEAQVVRHTSEGLGLEWCEFGQETVRALVRERVEETSETSAHAPVKVPRPRHGGVR